MPQPGQASIGAVGRQPVIDYLTKDYAGFRQGMLDQIPLLFPAWRDRSEADFGVVLIELFAYVADILSYYQDRVANESYLSTATQRRSVTELLRLIGYQIDPGLAASALIHFDARADLTVTGANLPFRLKTAGRPGEPDVTFEITREFALRAVNSSIELNLSGALPVSSTAIEIGRPAHALSVGDHIYFEQQVGGDPKNLRRSPRLTVTAVTAVSADRDEIRWLPPLPTEVGPSKTTLKGNNYLAGHGETMTDEPVFEGDGSAGQRFTLSRASVTHLLNSVAVRGRRSRPELEVRVDGVLWEEVDNLSASRPDETHYTTSVDENDALTITFGTGQRGSRPPARAEIRARYRTGLGASGNVGADTLTRIVKSVAGINAITNPFAAEGGADRESTDEARISGPGSVIAQERAVTLEDYRLLAQGFPGVAKAKARVGLRGGAKVVQVFMAPADFTANVPATPSEELKLGLKRHLEQRMPVNRMAGVDVLDPVYVQVDVAVDVHLRSDATRSRVFEQVRQTLGDLLGFAAQEFGRPVRVGELFSALFPLDGVAFVQLTRLARRGSSVPAPDCAFADLSMADDEIPVEGDLAINLIGGLR